MKFNLKKISFFMMLIALIFSFFFFDLHSFFTLEYIKSSQKKFNIYFQEQPLVTIGIYFLIYVITTSFSFPGAALLTLLGGALFGVFLGTVVVSFASTIGATLAFLGARYLFRDMIQNKYSNKLQSINDGVDKEGAFYLFSLRLIPILPFFFVNLIMGLTKMKASQYFFVSQIGMLPGTIAYVYAGTALSKIEYLKDILHFEVIMAFAVLGLLPLISKKTIGYIKRHNQIKND
ncbi:MAG: TVP38/TMEM64 family protein [Francisellaceae bacterium]|jgi:uncharacterized membrane protein YdjX (TVP38/TMEM64 family)|nr:TVP38/TMEM64 family protein [Francisellaceae bacterium]MBT6207969.1 TVP38/TMEM64 family protein [Francisellaceae bacterium]MBT6539892.1 TVP38/TMEM64 family protein [Francisellaceae bacterium]